MRKSNFNTPQLGNTFKRGNTPHNSGYQGAERHFEAQLRCLKKAVTHLKEATRASKRKEPL